MQYSGLFLVVKPSTNLEASLNTVNALIQGIESSFPSIRRGAPWSLSYRAFRDTIPPQHQPSKDAGGKPQPYAHAFQHLLHHSSLAEDRTFICIQPVSGQAAVTSMPLQQQDAHVLTMRQYMAALWSQRHALAIPQGATFGGGMFTIHVGELRGSREGPQSGTVQSPGVVVCISMLVGEPDVEAEGGASATTDGEIDFDFAQDMIRECWNMITEGRDIGRSEVREAMMAPTLTTHKEREREAAVRLWCDVLRLRGTVFDDSDSDPQSVFGHIPPQIVFDYLYTDWESQATLQGNDPLDLESKDDARRDSTQDYFAASTTNTSSPSTVVDLIDQDVEPWL